MLPNICRCKLCGVALVQEEIVDHITKKHKKDWLKALREEESYEGRC